MLKRSESESDSRQQIADSRLPGFEVKAENVGW